MHLSHSALAGNWQYHPLDADIFKKYLDEFFYSEPTKKKPAQRGYRQYRGTAKLIPSASWISTHTQLHQQLIASQEQNNIHMHKAALEEFIKLLKIFRARTLRESTYWNHYYIKPVDKWLKVSLEELERLKYQAQTTEPIVTNIYIAGEALQPRINDTIFVGRIDKRDQLTQEIWTASAMPLFLIQGQRRVGKTSLLNFLPEMLGSRFKVIYQDLQKRDVIRDIPSWLKDLRDRIDKKLNMSLSDWNPPHAWLEAWKEMREYLENITQEEGYKLILAFDEYESLHDIFQSDKETANQLLGAIRSFSQHQNRVAFLFVGANFFSELKSPNWNEYFVQAKHISVDYLEKSDCKKLITQPLPDF